MVESDYFATLIQHSRNRVKGSDAKISGHLVNAYLSENAIAANTRSLGDAMLSNPHITEVTLNGVLKDGNRNYTLPSGIGIITKALGIQNGLKILNLAEIQCGTGNFSLLSMPYAAKPIWKN